MMDAMTRKQRSAAAAALAVTAGAGTMLVALVAAPGAWWQGYVSEAGTSGQPYAPAYRWGLAVLSAGVALLAAAWWPAAPPGNEPQPEPVRAGRFDRHVPRLLRITPGLLAAAAALAATSGVVPCTDRCPLPPYEPTTTGDVVHTAASVLGLLTLAAAMAAAVVTGSRRAERRLAAVAVLPFVALGVALGATMLVVGRVTLGAVLERLVLVIAVSWLVGAALLTAIRPDRR